MKADEPAMNIATAYTLYGRRAGAEMFFERTLQTALRLFPDTRWTVFCNREAEAVLRQMCPQATLIPVAMLEKQLSKALWLEFFSRKAVAALGADVFWNPSGCNYFPGRWSIPTVTTFLDLGEYRVEGKYDSKRTVYRKQICIPRSVRRSAGFTAISKFTADDMAHFLSLRENVAVVHCGPSPHRMERVDGAAEELQSQFGIRSGRFFFVPGRTDYRGKGLDLILEAYSRLKTRFIAEEMKIVFVGSQGDGHAEFINRLQRLDAGQDNLLYLGRVEDRTLAALYQECLATVLPSRFEGFGFPVLEAMAAGVPVLCSDAGSLPEVAGGAALLFHSDEVDELCHQLVRLWDEPDLRARLREAGREQEGRFSWERSAQGLMEALIRVV